MQEAGFEPAKPKYKILSLAPLTARELLQHNMALFFRLIKICIYMLCFTMETNPTIIPAESNTYNHELIIFDSIVIFEP